MIKIGFLTNCKSAWRTILFFPVILLSTSSICAQEAPTPTTLLQDLNGDLVVQIMAFGDSIVYGKGDRIPPNSSVDQAPPIGRDAGWQARVETLLGVPVFNHGRPGERMTSGGIERFVADMSTTTADIVIIGEGSNDATFRVNPHTYYYTAQIMINLARAYGRLPVFLTIPPTCCDHRYSLPLIDEYNKRIRELAAINSIPLGDQNKAFNNSCKVSTCSLLNRPEGLHPNTAGYDVMSEVVSATLLNINLFAPDGPLLLDQALNRPAGTTKTVPDPAPPPAPTARIDADDNNNDCSLPSESETSSCI